jgi:hypothetical protein
VLNEDEGVFQRIRCRHRGAGALESLCDGHNDKGFILDDEDRANVGRCIKFPMARLSASCQRQGGLVRLDRGCPEVSTNPQDAQQNEMIDVGGKARVAGRARCCVVFANLAWLDRFRRVISVRHICREPNADGHI